MSFADRASESPGMPDGWFAISQNLYPLRGKRQDKWLPRKPDQLPEWGMRLLADLESTRFARPLKLQFNQEAFLQFARLICSAVISVGAKESLSEGFMFLGKLWA
jgi:hypothetical protein